MSIIPTRYDMGAREDAPTVGSGNEPDTDNRPVDTLPA